MESKSYAPLFVLLVTYACSSDPNVGTVRQTACGDAGSSGTSGAGGATDGGVGAGGAPSSGGDLGSGGEASGGTGTGGAQESGGAASGGDTGTGGDLGSGGAASGGAPGAGGAGTGGELGSGGSGSGGAPGTGGAVGSGGMLGSGGATGTGGAPAPYIRQAAEYHIIYPGPQNVPVTLPLSVLPGSAILVFATESLPESTPRPITVSDPGGSYALLDTIADTNDRSIMAVKSFARFGVAAGMTTVTAHYQFQTNWDAVTAAEVVGVSSVLAHGVRLQNLTNHAVDSATSGNLTVSLAPSLLVGFSISGVAIFGAPLAGTGFTNLGSIASQTPTSIAYTVGVQPVDSAHLTFVNWGGAEGSANKTSATLESKLLASPGTVTATFTPAGGSPPQSERLMTFGIVLQ